MNRLESILKPLKPMKPAQFLQLKKPTSRGFDKLESLLEPVKPLKRSSFRSLQKGVDLKKPEKRFKSSILYTHKTIFNSMWVGGRFKNTEFTKYQALRDPGAFLQGEKIL